MPAEGQDVEVPRNEALSQRVKQTKSTGSRTNSLSIKGLDFSTSKPHYPHPSGYASTVSISAPTYLAECETHPRETF